MFEVHTVKEFIFQKKKTSTILKNNSKEEMAGLA